MAATRFASHNGRSRRAFLACGRFTAVEAPVTDLDRRQPPVHPGATVWTGPHRSLRASSTLATGDGERVGERVRDGEQRERVDTDGSKRQRSGRLAACSRQPSPAGERNCPRRECLRASRPPEADFACLQSPDPSPNSSGTTRICAPRTNTLKINSLTRFT